MYRHVADTYQRINWPWVSFTCLIGKILASEEKLSWMEFFSEAYL